MRLQCSASVLHAALVCAEESGQACKSAALIMATELVCHFCLGAPASVLHAALVCGEGYGWPVVRAVANPLAFMACSVARDPLAYQGAAVSRFDVTAQLEAWCWQYPVHFLHV
jgi:hypothetical protein